MAGFTFGGMINLAESWQGAMQSFVLEKKFKQPKYTLYLEASLPLVLVVKRTREFFWGVLPETIITSILVSSQYTRYDVDKIWQKLGLFSL